MRPPHRYGRRQAAAPPPILPTSTRTARIPSYHRDGHRKRKPFKWTRHISPLYLHCKLFLLTSFITLFIVRPITSDDDGMLARAQTWVDEARVRRGLPLVPALGIKGVKESLEEIQKVIRAGGGVQAVRIAITTDATTSNSNEGRRLITAPTRRRGLLNRIKIILHRWQIRLSDLLDVSDIEESSWDDVVQHPEILRTGQVRLHETSPSPEKIFIDARRQFMLPHFRQLMQELGHERPSLRATDLPLIGIGGSGGGFRAMLGYAAFLDAIQADLWDLTTWTSGVSGSCWTLGSLYTHCRLSTTDLLEHYRRLTSEQMHPMSVPAFSLVARSRRGNAFLFGPLLRKRRLFEHVKGGSIMDLLSTLTSTYLLLPRHSHLHTAPANQGLSQIGMSWSKSYQYNGLDRGEHPLPVLSAIRVSHDDRNHNGHDRDRHDHNGHSELSPSPSNMQWWEFTPLEAGSCDANRDNSQGVFTPLWSFSRKYNAGTSTSLHCPEISFSTILGHCTSALAGPLTGYIQALLSTLPSDTVMSRLLRKFNNFLQWKTWEKRWANPIRSSKEWNPWYGMKKSNGKKDHNPKIKLMDAGISNNLPAHIFYTPPTESEGRRHRKADIFIAFDASSDTSTPMSLERVARFGKERGLKFEFAQESLDVVQRLREEEALHYPPIQPDASSSEKEHQQTMSLDSYLLRQASLQTHLKSLPKPQNQPYNTQYKPYYCVILNGYPLSSSISEKPSMIYIYCPLLPHDSNPSLDPSNSEFAKVYNLLWNRSQTESIFRTVNAATEEFVVGKIRQVIKRWIQQNTEAGQKEVRIGSAEQDDTIEERTHGARI